MLTRRFHRLLYLVFGCACAVSTQAAPLKIHTAKVAPDSTHIWVQFETPVPLKNCDVEFPANSCAGPWPAPPWDFVVYDKNGTLLLPAFHLKTSSVIGKLQADALVDLELDAKLPNDYSRIDVTFRLTTGAPPHFSIEQGTPPTTKWASPSKTKDDSNVYLSGTFAPANGSSPTYTIDSKGSYILRSFEKGRYTISATGDVNTDKKKTADPDSFHWAIPVQYVSKSNFTAQFPTIGMELDKKGNAINLVSAPSATKAFGHVFTTKDPKNSGADKVAASVGLELTAGLEFGSNLKNDYAVANKTIGGQGWFFRGVPAANVYLIIPNIWKLNKISLTTSYTARIPTTDEVFIETRNVAKPVPELTNRTRNFVQSTLNLMLTEYIGIQIKYQYGSLPPAFNFVQSSGSIGLVFGLKETRVPQ